MADSLAGAPAPELSDKLRGRQLPHIGLLSRAELEEVIAATPLKQQSSTISTCLAAISPQASWMSSMSR